MAALANTTTTNQITTNVKEIDFVSPSLLCSFLTIPQPHFQEVCM